MTTLILWVVMGCVLTGALMFLGWRRDQRRWHKERSELKEAARQAEERALLLSKHKKGRVKEGKHL